MARDFWLELFAARSTGGVGHVSVALMSSMLAPGLLLAAPPLSDPNFERSVVLLSAHGPDGAFGWVLNGAESMSLAELFERTQLTPSEPQPSGVVRFGGPVSQEQVWLLYPSGVLPVELEGQLQVAEGITASASRKVLEVIASGSIPPELIALMGYAGWAPWQLENEIKQGAWLPTDVDAEMVFATPRAELWARAYQRVGASPMAFTSRTVGSA